MSRLQWSHDYSGQIPAIDNQHRQLIEIVNSSAAHWTPTKGPRPGSWSRLWTNSHAAPGSILNLKNAS